MVTLTQKTLDFNHKIKLSNDKGSLEFDTFALQKITKKPIKWAFFIYFLSNLLHIFVVI